MKQTETNILENTLVWSAARAKALATCRRKYFFNYIGSWLGWDMSSAPETQAAYRVKGLTTPELELGQIIHDQIRSILQKSSAGVEINRQVEIRIAQERFKTFVEYSKQRQLEELTAKRRKLLIHEEGRDLSAKQLAGYVGKIEELLLGFFSFDDVGDLLRTPSALIIEMLDQPGFQIGEELGVPSRPRTDAVFMSSGKVVICDWKTGEIREDHRFTALVYDIFARKKLKLPPSAAVEVRFYYLGARQKGTHQFTEGEREEMLWLIDEQFREMQRLSDDPQINTGPEQRFPATVSQACFYCNHRLMCPEFMAKKFATTL